MFRQTIGLTPPFTRDIHNAVGIMEEVDSTLFMTATTLLHNRVDNLRLSCTVSRPSIAGISIESINFNPEIYSFHWFVTENNPDELIETVKDKFKTVIAAQNIERFISEKSKRTIRIRIFPNENAVCFFVDDLSNEIWHFVQSFISKYFEVFKEKPLTEKETEFVRTLTLKTAANYTAKLIELTDSDSFKRFALEIQLKGFEKKLYEKKRNVAKENIDMYQRELDRLMDELRSMTKKHLDAKIFYEGLIHITENIEEKTELQEYLLNNKNLSNITIDENHIRFVVKTFLTPYHMDDWENMSRRGAIFDGVPGFTNADCKLLLDAIFSENHSLKLRICGHVDLDYLYADVRSNTGYDYSKIKNYVPNTHLSRHSCFGQNKPDIIDQLRSGDAIGAIECSINCVKHMNVNELGASFTPFMRNVMNFEGKCIVTEDGQEMTPREAIAYLKGQNNENNLAE